VCLTTRYTELLPLTVLCFAKELSQGIGGILLLKKNVRAQGARWFGKASTVLFYATMLVVVLWYDTLNASAPWALWLLLGLVGVSMLMAFGGYLQMYLRIRRDVTPKKG
jgi:cardiolipin synthase